MSAVTPDQVRALVETDLVDSDLQDVIDREEAALARVIGPLEGERTQVAYIDTRPDNTYLPIVLMRPTDEVVVTPAGSPTDPAWVLRERGRLVERVPNTGAWSGPVSMTYTPNDLLEVQRVIIELARLTLTETGYLGETIGDYSYTRGARGGALNPTEAARQKLIQTLVTPLPAHTQRLVTSRQIDRPQGWIGNWNDPYA